jgi:hypothetical protein
MPRTRRYNRSGMGSIDVSVTHGRKRPLYAVDQPPNKRPAMQSMIFDLEQQATDVGALFFYHSATIHHIESTTGGYDRLVGSACKSATCKVAVPRDENETLICDVYGPMHHQGSEFTDRTILPVNVNYEVKHTQTTASEENTTCIVEVEVAGAFDSHASDKAGTTLTHPCNTHIDNDKHHENRRDQETKNHHERVVIDLTDQIVDCTASRASTCKTAARLPLHSSYSEIGAHNACDKSDDECPVIEVQTDTVDTTSQSPMRDCENRVVINRDLSIGRGREISRKGVNDGPIVCIHEGKGGKSQEPQRFETVVLDAPGTIVYDSLYIDALLPTNTGDQQQHDGVVLLTHDSDCSVPCVSEATHHSMHNSDSSVDCNDKKNNEDVSVHSDLFFADCSDGDDRSTDSNKDSQMYVSGQASFCGSFDGDNKHDDVRCTELHDFVESLESDCTVASTASDNDLPVTDNSTEFAIYDEYFSCCDEHEQEQHMDEEDISGSDDSDICADTQQPAPYFPYCSFVCREDCTGDESYQKLKVLSIDKRAMSDDAEMYKHAEKMADSMLHGDHHFALRSRTLVWSRLPELSRMISDHNYDILDCQSCHSSLLLLQIQMEFMTSFQRAYGVDLNKYSSGVGCAFFHYIYSIMQEMMSYLRLKEKISRTRRRCADSGDTIQEVEISDTVGESLGRVQKRRREVLSRISALRDGGYSSVGDIFIVDDDDDDDAMAAGVDDSSQFTLIDFEADSFARNMDDAEEFCLPEPYTAVVDCYDIAREIAPLRCTRPSKKSQVWHVYEAQQRLKDKFSFEPCSKHTILEELGPLHSIVAARIASGMHHSALSACHNALFQSYKSMINGHNTAEEHVVSTSHLHFARYRTASLWCLYAHVLVQAQGVIDGDSGDGTAITWMDLAMSILNTATRCPLVGNHYWISVALSRLTLKSQLAEKTVSSRNISATVAVASQLCWDGIKRARAIPSQACTIARLKTEVGMLEREIEDLISKRSTASESSDIGELECLLQAMSDLSLTVTPTSRSYMFQDKYSAMMLCEELNRLCAFAERRASPDTGKGDVDVSPSELDAFASFAFASLDG